MIGQMRLEKIQKAKRSDVDLTASLQALTGSSNTQFVFEEELRPEWTELHTEDMSDAERQMAEDTWAQSNAIEVARLRSEDTEESYGLCCIHDYLPHEAHEAHDLGLARRKPCSWSSFATRCYFAAALRILAPAGR